MFGVSLAVYARTDLHGDRNLQLSWNRRNDMFDSKMLLVILAIALVIFGTKRLRSIWTDLGAAVKGFKQAMNDGESAEQVKHLKQDADFDTSATAAASAQAAREAEVKVPPKTNA
jgi:sec-independent protein translocase protein TatA